MASPINVTRNIGILQTFSTATGTGIIGRKREMEIAGRTKHPELAALHARRGGKVVGAREAVDLIRDGDTIATGGFVGIGFAENLAVALEERYLETGAP